MFRKPFSTNPGLPATAVIGETLRACRPGERRRRRLTDTALVVLTLMQDLQQHRGLSGAVLSGQRDLRDECEAVGEKLQRSLVAMSDASAAARQELERSPPWQPVLAGWESLQHAWRELDFHTNLAVHSALVLDLAGILRDLGEAHRETLGERQGRVVAELPPMVEHLGMLRALGLRLIATPAAREHPPTCGALKLHLHEARSTLAASADLIDGSALPAISDAAVAEVAAMRERWNFAIDAHVYHATMTRAIDAWYVQIRNLLQGPG